MEECIEDLMGAKSLTLFLSLLLFSCGDISLKPGTGLSLTEPLPTGARLLTQGGISTASTTITLAGSAQVYQAADGTVVIRLAGFSTNTAGLFLFLETGSDISFYTIRLRATAGQQNYFTGAPNSGQIFSRVVFRELPNTNAVEIGSAILVPVL